MFITNRGPTRGKIITVIWQIYLYWFTCIIKASFSMAEAGFYYTGKSIQVYLSNDCNDFPPCGPSIGNKHILSYWGPFREFSGVLFTLFLVTLSLWVFWLKKFPAFPVKLRLPFLYVSSKSFLLHVLRCPCGNAVSDITN
jgi:hypothetical protein